VGFTLTFFSVKIAEMDPKWTTVGGVYSMTKKYRFADVKDIFNDKCKQQNLALLDYNEDTMKITFNCNKCHNSFDRIYRYRLLAGLKCPFCSGEVSTYEFLTYKILQFNDIKNILGYVIQDQSINFQHLDFYLEDRNLALEVQGNQHKNTKNGWFNNSFERDSRKLNWCKKHGIELKYLYANGDLTIFEQLELILGKLKKPPYTYFDKNEPHYKEVISYLKGGHNLKETISYFNLGIKTVNRFIVTAGYKNYWDLYHQTRMEKLGLTNEKIIEWLRYNHFSHIKRGLGITEKYVINHIFNNPKYPYNNTVDIKIETVCSPLWDDYLKTHSKRNTARHFMTDPETVEKYRQKYGISDSYPSSK
jgi:hypothetical protein